MEEKQDVNILIVEDDIDINNLLLKIVQKDGMNAIQAFSGTEAQLRISITRFDLVLLDLMLPGIAGEELIPEIEKKDIPVIVLSAKAGLGNRVEVLNLGADDYIIKPFEAEEVIARINALLRRIRKKQNQCEVSGTDIEIEVRNENDLAGDTFHNKNIDNCITYRDLCVNIESRKVTLGNHELSLTIHEFDILCILIKNPTRVFSRQALYETVWQGGYYGEDNTVNVHISNLRKKIAEIAGAQEYIKTVWGIGFKLD